MITPFGRWLFVFAPFVCVLTAIAQLVPDRYLSGGSAFVFVVFGALGLTAFWRKFWPGR